MSVSNEIIVHAHLGGGPGREIRIVLVGEALAPGLSRTSAFCGRNFAVDSLRRQARQVPLAEGDAPTPEPPDVEEPEPATAPGAVALPG